MRPECIKLSVAPMAFILLAVGVAVGAGQRVPSDEGGSDYDAAQRPPPPSLDEDVVLLTRVCMVAPAFYPTPGEPGKAVAPAAEVGLILMQSMLLALEHVNSRNCTVLGDGCATLLDAGGGRRVRLRPYLVNLPSEDAQASGPAVQACANTDAQFIAASFTSSQTSLVASFVSALGKQQSCALYTASTI